MSALLGTRPTFPSTNLSHGFVELPFSRQEFVPLPWPGEIRVLLSGRGRCRDRVRQLRSTVPLLPLLSAPPKYQARQTLDFDTRMMARMIAVLAIAAAGAHHAAAAEMDEGWATAALIKAAETGNTQVLEGILKKSGEFKARLPQSPSFPKVVYSVPLGALLRGQPIRTTDGNALASHIPCSVRSPLAFRCSFPSMGNLCQPSTL